MDHWVRTVLEDAILRGTRLPERTHSDIRRIAELIEGRDIYAFRNPDLEDLADELSECADLGDLSRLMWTAAVECGFQHYIVFLLERGDAMAFKTRVCTSYPLPWVERYQERSYQFIDPVMAAAMVSNDPFRFSDLPNDTPITRAFWKDAAEHGVGAQGICQAFELAGGTRIGVSFCSSKSSSEMDRVVRMNASDALCMARISAEVFGELARVTPPSADFLTAAELRFLHILVTADNPEEALSVIPGLGSNAALQSSIRNKLGVATILQAVAIASSNRWFDELPYDIRDVAHAAPALYGGVAPTGDESTAEPK